MDTKPENDDVSAKTDEASGMRLTDVRLVNFRRTEDVSISVPSPSRVLCLVGENGAGKSSLLSIISELLRGFTLEIGPDVGSSMLGDEGAANIRRSISTNEVRLNQSGYGFSADFLWGADKKFKFARSVAKDRDQWNADAKDLGFPTLAKRNWMTTVTTPREPPAEDPVAHSVLLFRPADRHERPVYEEPENLTAEIGIQDLWDKRRLLPVHEIASLQAVESFILDMIMDSGSAHGKLACGVMKDVIRRVCGEELELRFSSWPYRRLSIGEMGPLSTLSAGELDVIVTSVLILRQQTYLQSKWETKDRAGGIVIIDEIAAHLHPDMQERALPLLTEMFPEIQFIVTTHSPFVLRSMGREKMHVCRLPDGRSFNEDFSAWTTEEILATVFQVSGKWSTAVAKEISRFQEAVANENPADAAELYTNASRSPSLKNEFDRVMTLEASDAVRDAIRAGTKLDGALESGTLDESD